MEHLDTIQDQYSSKSSNKGRTGDRANQNAKVPRKEQKMNELYFTATLIQIYYIKIWNSLILKLT